MKKLIALLVAVSLLCSMVFASVAEDKKADEIFGSIGSFFSDVWSDVSDWVDGVWEDASKWIDSAWGDASKWIEQAWNDSSSWIGDIWGDASTWVSDTVSAWWTDTFQNVTEDGQKAWTWISDQAADLKAQGTELVDRMKSATAETGDAAKEQVNQTIALMLEKLGINGADTEKIMETLTAYAEQNGVSSLSVAKIAMPYLLQLCADSMMQPGGNIPAVAVAQFLTGIFEKNNVNNDHTVDALLNQLMTALSGI